MEVLILVLQSKLIYVLFLDSKGTPSVMFLSIENIKHVMLMDLKLRLKGDADGASVKTGIRRGIGIKIKEDVPWSMLVHCFNHHLELAIKDVFRTTFLTKLT